MSGIRSFFGKDPTKHPAKLGAPWKEEDIQQLLADVKNKLTHEEIANKHERTVGGISSRLRELAADYYFNNELPIEKIQKYTGLSTEQIADAISKRQYKMDQKEKKGVPPSAKLVSDPLDLKQDDSSELKEILVVLKDIQSMMKEFLEGKYVKVKKSV